MIWYEKETNDIKIDTNVPMFYQIYITIATTFGTPYHLPLTVNVTSSEFREQINRPPEFSVYPRNVTYTIRRPKTAYRGFKEWL